MTLKEHAKDICVCGDYRSEHRDGNGPCKHNKPLDLTHGYRDCTAFQLATAYDQAAKEQDGHE